MSSITFLGACAEVTGSKFLITNKKHNIMFDFGMVQGYKDEAYIKNKYFAEDSPYVDDCVLSHAHIDHSGLLPCLISKGLSGHIFTTPPTYDLCRHMLKDSVKVFEKEAPIIARILKKKRIKERVLPLYDETDVELCLSRFVTKPYNETFKIRDTQVTFHDSCHILGSASVNVDINDNNVHHNVWYTADIGSKGSVLSNELQTPQDIEYLVIESTYGSKQRVREDVYETVAQNVCDAFKRGGRIVIPTFSVGRMQTLLLIIHKLQVQGRIPVRPIYVDSPLGLKATKIYRKYEDEINQETIRWFRDQNIDPFADTNINYVEEGGDSMSIARSDEQCIVLSASGMIEGGRVREHVKCMIEDKNSTILFVGYCAESTLGRRIQDSTGSVKIDNEMYRIRCKTPIMQGFSAHADLDELVQYVENAVSANNIKQIFLVHGDEKAVHNFKRQLSCKGITNVTIPKLNKKYEL